MAEFQMKKYWRNGRIFLMRLFLWNFIFLLSDERWSTCWVHPGVDVNVSVKVMESLLDDIWHSQCWRGGVWSGSGQVIRGRREDTTCCQLTGPASNTVLMSHHREGGREGGREGLSNILLWLVITTYGIRHNSYLTDWLRNRYYISVFTQKVS